jgi:hypothetical protein
MLITLSGRRSDLPGAEAGQSNFLDQCQSSELVRVASNEGPTIPRMREDDWLVFEATRGSKAVAS